MSDKPRFPLFDAHCHYAPAPEADHQGNSGLYCTAPDAAGPVRGRILCGVSPGDWSAVAEISASWPGTISAFGFHPWHVPPEGGDWEGTLRTFLAKRSDAWVGEVGLDNFRIDAAPAARQNGIFRLQLRLAREFGRPVNLHCVKAWPELVATLDDEYLDGPRPFIVHSFSGPQQFIRPLAERGAYFTFGPLAARPGSRRAAERAALVPAERLLLESDAFVEIGQDALDGLVETLSWLARVRGLSVDETAERLDSNSRRLFSDGQ